MGRRARDNRDLPHPKPVQKIQLSEGNVGLRAAVAVVLLVIGVTALVYTFTNLLTPDAGWQTIEVNTSVGTTCGDEFVFLYELGAGIEPVSEESRAVTSLYSSACRTAFQLFHTVESFEGVVNLREINLHPNEVLTVDGALYRAFEAVQRHGDRTIYLGPVYARYNDLFFCQDDSQAPEFDPWSSADVAEEYAAYAAYAIDPGHIDVELLGENQICLRVSEDYLAFAEREGIDRFLDFGWLKNAFVVDYLADVLTENGYTHGSVSSYDGFNRNLDDRGQTYALNVYDFTGGAAYHAAAMEYQGARSIVYLRDYPVDSGDDPRIYQRENGEVRTSYLSPADGRCRSSAHDLICYSEAAGCGEIALQIAPIYVTEELDISALKALADSGIHSIRCEDRVILGTDTELVLTNLYEKDGVRYTLSLG